MSDDDDSESDGYDSQLDDSRANDFDSMDEDNGDQSKSGDDENDIPSENAQTKDADSDVDQMVEHDVALNTA